MNTITNTHSNNSNINKASNSAISKDKVEFCRKLDKLKDSIKEKDNKKETQHGFIFESGSVNKIILNHEKNKSTDEDQLSLNIPFYQIQDSLQICPNNNIKCLSSQNATVVQSLQEIANYIDKFCLSTQTQTTSLHQIWNFSYTDDKGIDIEFRLLKAKNEQFNLSCSISSNNLKKYIHELSEKLNKKGWALVGDDSNINYKIIKVTQN